MQVYWEPKEVQFSINKSWLSSKHGEADVNKMQISVVQQLAVVIHCSEKAEGLIKAVRRPDQQRFFILQ